MTIQTVLNNTKIEGFSLADKALIEDALTELYNKSSATTTHIAQTMMDKITQQQKLSIYYSPGAFGVYVLGSFIISADLTLLHGATYITPNGKAVAITLVATLAHEMEHAINSLGEIPNYPNFSGDFAGQTVTQTNKIYQEIGIEQRLSYNGGGLSSDIIAGMNYTNGLESLFS